MSQRLPSRRFMIVVGLLITLIGVAMMRSSQDRPAGLAFAAVMVLLGIGGIVSAARAGEPPQPSEPGARATGQYASEIPDPAPALGALIGASPAEIPAAFASWLKQLDPGESLWPAFDRWLRDTLDHHLQGRQVRCMRVEKQTRRLSPIDDRSELSTGWQHPPPGLIDHVLTAGRRYVRGAREQGELIDSLANEWTGDERAGEQAGSRKAPDWLAPIHHRGEVIGLLSVGHLPPEVLREPAALQNVAWAVELCWSYVAMADALEHAQRIDPGSGVLNRNDLAAGVDLVLRQSREEGEPVVMVVLAVEGLRRLDDQGERAERDWLIKQIGQVIRHRLRSDDLVGRFNDDHFVAVLRRLDVSLGKLIVRKILQGAGSLIAARPGLRQIVQVRCALSDETHDGFDTALNQVMDTLQQARQLGQELATTRDPAMAETRS